MLSSHTGATYAARPKQHPSPCETIDPLIVCVLTHDARRQVVAQHKLHAGRQEAASDRQAGRCVGGSVDKQAALSLP
jgi:hypothetical protein